MSKLLKLKEWVTLEEAARHLSLTLGEEVVVADILRLGLDGPLTLSVYFVNHAHGKAGKITTQDEAGYIEDFPSDWKAAKAAEAAGEKYSGGYSKIPRGVQLSDGSVIALQNTVLTLEGVYDLPMIGGERLDIEHKYQRLTGGPELTLSTIDGAYVVDEDGDIFELQDDYDDNEFCAGSEAQLEKIQRMINLELLTGEDAEKALLKHAEDSANFKEKRKAGKWEERFYPGGGLPKDAVLVVRTAELKKFQTDLAEPEAPEASTGKPEDTMTGPPQADQDEKPLLTRERNTYLNAIGALLELVLEHYRHKQDAVIIEINSRYPGKGGLSRSKLERLFPAAKDAVNRNE